MCGYLPQWVENSAVALKDSVRKYVFISSVSVYDDSAKPNFNEGAKLNYLTSKQEKRFAEIDEKGDFNAADLGEMYGALKVLCEEEVQKTFTENHLIIRPGLIVGEYDFTDRFTYWVMRVGRGGEVLTPANPDAPVQFIDAKDLAEWIIKLIENDEKGIYNAVNKPFEITFGNLLKTIKEVSGSNAEFTWVSEEFMDENNVAPWSDMPLHLPESLEFMRTANVDKAFSKGLQIRPLHKTVREILDWRKTVDEPIKAGISVEREKELLRKWHEQNSK
jgi:2'-hydroxyisoflavone reductase